MATYEITEKLRAKINQMYEGESRDRVIKELESGKTVYHGAGRFKANKIEDKAGKSEKVAPAVSAKVNEKDKDNK